MTQKMAAVVPSRGRPKNIVRLAKAFEDTKATADLWVIIDEDDWYRKDYEKNAAESNYQYIVVENISGGICKPLNMAIEILMDDETYPHYSSFAVMGDDALPRTDFWDYILSISLPYNKPGIVYCDDKFQGQNLVTHPVFNREIVDRMGFLCPPGLTHLYSDNFWMILGSQIESLYYNPRVVIEHLHPIAKKGDWDEGYERVNRPELYEKDKAALEAFIASPAFTDLVNSLKEGSKPKTNGVSFS